MRLIAILLLILLTGYRSSYGEPLNGLVNSPDVQVAAVITTTIDSSAPQLQILEGAKRVNLEHFASFQFTPEKSGEYEVISLCDAGGRMGIAVLDSNSKVLSLGDRDSLRYSRTRARATLLARHRYYVLIGCSRLLTPARLIFSITQLGDREHWPNSNDLSQPISVGNSSQELGRPVQSFEGLLARHYRLAKKAGKDEWVRIRGESKEFDPVLWVLNSSDEIIDVNDDLAVDDSTAEVIIGPADTVSHFVVTGRGIAASFKDTLQTRPFKLSIETHPYDPRGGLLAALRYRLSDPVTTFGLGILFSTLLGWLFYYRGVHLRRLAFMELQDHTIINEPQDSNLKLKCGAEEFNCASLYKLRCWNAGHRRIKGDLIRGQISVELANVMNILTIDQTSEGSGWKPPTKLSNNSFRIDFEYVDPADTQDIHLICQQERNAPSLDIDPEICCSIAETRISLFTGDISRSAQVGLSIIMYIYVGLFLLSILDSIFDFWTQGFARYLGWFYSLTAIPFVGYMVLTRMGRRALRSYFRALWRPIRTLFVQTRDLPLSPR